MTANLTPSALTPSRSDHVPADALVVFGISALTAPAYGWLLSHLSGGGKLTLGVFQNASWAGMAGIVLAIGLACFLRETGRASRPTVPLVLAAKAPS